MTRKQARRFINSIFDRGVMGPYVGMRKLTPEEIEVYCDGDRATRPLRDSVIVHKDGTLVTLLTSESSRIQTKLSALGLIRYKLSGLCAAGR